MTDPSSFSQHELAHYITELVMTYNTREKLFNPARNQRLIVDVHPLSCQCPMCLYKFGGEAESLLHEQKVCTTLK